MAPIGLGHERHVTGQRLAVVAAEARELGIRHPGTQAKEHPLHALGGENACVLEIGNFRRRAARAQAVAGMHHESGGVDYRWAAREIPKRVDQIGRQVDGVGAIGVFGIGEVLPADAPDLGAGADPLAGENIANLSARITRLIEKGEGLEALRAKLPGRIQRAHPQISLAFVSDHDQGISIPRHDQDGFLEARIEISEVGEVREMLAIRVDDQVSEAVRGHCRTQLIEPLLQLGGLDGGRAFRQPERRPVDFDQLMSLGRTGHSLFLPTSKYSEFISMPRSEAPRRRPRG